MKKDLSSTDYTPAYVGITILATVFILSLMGVRLPRAILICSAAGGILSGFQCTFPSKKWLYASFAVVIFSIMSLVINWTIAIGLLLLSLPAIIASLLKYLKRPVVEVSNIYPPPDNDPLS